MSLEADPEPEKVRLCVSQKLLGLILASLHVFAFPVLLAVIFVQFWEGDQFVSHQKQVLPAFVTCRLLIF